MSSNPLWDRAVEEVRSTPEWGSYRKILSRRIGSDQTNAQNDQASATEFDGQPQAVLDIVHDALQAIQDKADTDKSKPLRRLLSQTVSILTSVKDAGSAIAALNPYASLAWSGIHFLLQLSVINREASEVAWDNLPRITYLVSHYQTFEQVFLQPLPSNTAALMLDNALVALYTAILRYQIAVIIRVGSKMEKFKRAFQCAAKSSIQRAVSEVTEKEKDIDRVRVIVDRATTTHLLEKVSQQDQARISELFANLEKCQTDLITSQEYVVDSVGEILTSSREARDEVVLSWLSEYRYENSHNKPEKTALKDTGSWLLQHDAYREWKTSSQSALWLRGFVGSGKSCLTHVVIEDLRNSSPHSVSRDEALAFFYFEGVDNDSVREMSDSALVLRCLIKQIAMAKPGVPISSSITEAWKSYHHKADLPVSQCVQILKSLLSGFESTMIVFDGFDECPYRVQRDLVRHLRSILADENTNLRLFISGRPFIETSIRALDCSVLNIGENNTQDIYRVIDVGIAEALSDPALEELYIDGAEDQSSAVRDVLRTHANGMFRWVMLAFNYLHKSLHYDAMTRRLKSLPSLEDLFDLYDTMWQSLMDELDDEDRSAVRTALTFALWGYPSDYNRVTGTEPFDITGQRVVQAASFRSKTSTNPNLTLKKIGGWCNAFVIHEYWGERRYYRLKFPHFSAAEYLKWRHAYWFSEVEGHSFLTCLCMDVWIHPFTGMKELARYALVFWADHLRRLRQLKPGPDGLQRLLEEKPDLRESVGKFITDDNPTESFSRWTARVVEGPRDGFAITGISPEFATIPCTATVAMIFFNIGLHHQTATIKDFSKTYYNISYSYSENALSFAAQVGNLHAIELILADKDKFPKSRDDYWQLRFSTWRGRWRSNMIATTDQVVDLLMSHGIDVRGGAIPFIDA